MTYYVQLFDTKKRKKAWVRQRGAYDEAAEYLWEDGNYACDCNRALLFNWALGRPGYVNQRCGSRRYEVLKVKEVK